MRDLERTPVLSRDEVVISKNVQRDLQRLATKLSPRTQTVERRWRRRLKTVFAGGLSPSGARALASINPGAWADLLAAGNISAFLEQVDYHGRRLAKLDVPPNSVLESLKEYEEALAPDLKRFFPGNYGRYLAALDHLNFCIKLTLNSAYYQVRDSEAQAFYEVFQDQLQSLSVDDLMARVLATLMRTFRAQGGVILLLEEESRRLVAKAWNGMEESLATRFNAAVGRGLVGKIAGSGKPLAVTDVAGERLVRSAEIREAFRSIWGVPLVVDGEVRGVLHLGFSREYHCLPREMTLLEAIAERCAMAIDKARLLEDLHDREEKIRQLGEHMLKVEEEERRRISRELHDEVGQSMLVIRLYLEMLRGNLPHRGKELGSEARGDAAVDRADDPGNAPPDFGAQPECAREPGPAGQHPAVRQQLPPNVRGRRSPANVRVGRPAARHPDHALPAGAGVLQQHHEAFSCRRRGLERGPQERQDSPSSARRRRRLRSFRGRAQARVVRTRGHEGVEFFRSE